MTFITPLAQMLLTCGVTRALTGMFANVRLGMSARTVRVGISTDTSLVLGAVASGKPVTPSFLLEVMALDLLRPPFQGNFPYEFIAFFATAADRINETWPDPAGLGPPVSDSMDATARSVAKDALTKAHHAVREAIQLANGGKNGDSLRKYRELFGDFFPLS